MRIGVIGRVEPDMFGANISKPYRAAGDMAVSLRPAWASRRLMVTSRAGGPFLGCAAASSAPSPCAGTAPLWAWPR